MRLYFQPLDDSRRRETDIIGVVLHHCVKVASRPAIAPAFSHPFGFLVIHVSRSRRELTVAFLLPEPFTIEP